MSASHHSTQNTNGRVPGPHVIRITRLSLLGVLMLLFGVLFPFGGWPQGLWWLFALPIFALVWVLRTQTTLTDDGLRLRTMVGSRSVGWDRIAGVRFPKHGFARAVLVDGGEVTLPAVGFDRLPELAAHSGGRIADPYVAAKQRDNHPTEPTDDHPTEPRDNHPTVPRDQDPTVPRDQDPTVPRDQDPTVPRDDYPTDLRDQDLADPTDHTAPDQGM